MGIFRFDPPVQLPARNVPIPAQGDTPPFVFCQAAAMMAVVALSWPQETPRLTQKQSNPPQIAAIAILSPVPIRGMYGAQRPDASFRAWTPRLWDWVQPFASGGGFVAPTQIDNPPVRAKYSATVRDSWNPEEYIQLPDMAGATLPVQGDEPPRIGHLHRRIYATIIQSWEPPFTYRLRPPKQIISVDNPPPFRRQRWYGDQWIDQGQTVVRLQTVVPISMPDTILIGPLTELLPSVTLTEPVVRAEIRDLGPNDILPDLT